jgi:hypothetical protein
MSLLPPGFAALDPFVADWALGSTAARAAQRNASSAESRQGLYDAGAPLLGAALELLDCKPLAEHSEEEQRLMDLCLALAHVALAIEALGSDEAAHAPSRAAMIITRSPADA